jgi:serine phosphatase RsbU (regulator of sigma subunit)
MRLFRWVASLPVVVAGGIVALFSAGMAITLVFSYDHYLRTRGIEALKTLTRKATSEMNDQTLNGIVMGGAVLSGILDEAVKKSASGEYEPDDPRVVDRLRVIVDEYDAGDAFVVSKNGKIVAYKVSKGKKSGTGTDVRFRSYYQNAIKGIRNVYAAVGTTTGKRGLYYAAPIHEEFSSASPVIGVIVIKVKPDGLETQLARLPGPAFLLSPQYVVFASNIQRYQFHVAGKVTVALHEALNRYKQFGKMFLDHPPHPLDFDLSGEWTTIEGELHAIARTPVNWNDPLGPWTLVVLENTANWLSYQHKWIISLVLSAILFFLGVTTFVAMKNHYRGKQMEVQRDEAFKSVWSSIQYASRIQRAILPQRSVLKSVIPNHFVVWEPRDMVGGDMYWYRPWDLGSLIILGDCTGHGVPGAFMTLISNGALEGACLETPPGDTATLLQRMNQLIQDVMGQDREDGADEGLELGVCYLDPETDRIIFSGARFSLFIADGKTVREIKGNKSGIGYCGVDRNIRFTRHEVPLRLDWNYYMTSDGLIDQVGGENARGFGKRRFMNLIADIYPISMEEQAKRIKHVMIEFQGSQSRRDDVSVLGFKGPVLT